MNGYAQLPRHRQHLLQGLQNAAALLTHMHRHGDALPRQGCQSPHQLLGGVKAFRGVPQAQGYPQGPVSQSLLHGLVDGLIVLLLQPLQGVARRTGPQHPRTHQHPGVQRGVRLVFKVGRQGVCGDGRGHLPAYGLQIGGDFRPAAAADRRGGETAVAVYNGRKPLAQLRLAEPGPVGRQVRVAVDVNESRRHQLSPGTNDPPCVGLGQLPHLDDFSVFHRHIGGVGGPAGAVYHRAVPNQKIDHASLPLFVTSFLARGNVTVNRVTPWALVQPMLPRWLCTMVRAMARPSPKPSPPVRDSSTR